MKKSLFLLLFCLPCLLSSRIVDTFYGPLEVEEPLLLELIDSPAFQRLKHIHQYGVSYYTTHKEEYNRYDHSIGVFTILRTKGASLEEQVAGLLHDVSHTVFSHVGDWIFGKENKEKDYQNSIHTFFLKESGLESILNKYGFTTDEILPSEELFPLLENSLPDLCADRIDYNIQGAYHQGFITYEEAIVIFKDISFIDNRWVSKYPKLMKKLALFSFFMTQGCWGSPINHLTSRWLADAILRGIDVGCITLNEVHFGTDQAVWDKLICHEDPIIQASIDKVLHPNQYFSLANLTDAASLPIKSKFRGIDPWIVTESKLLRLTELDAEIREEFANVKAKMAQGWAVKLLDKDEE